jgi:hypothetical protein
VKALKAFAFNVKITSDTIKIPQAYLDEIKGARCRVLLLVEDEAMVKVPPQKRVFKAGTVKTKGFKFNREEANAR